LTFDWSTVALSHIYEFHILLRKLLHTHTHTLHELSLLLKNFYLQGNFCAYWLLTLNYILVYIWNAIWLFYKLFIYACSEANIKIFFFFCIFPSALSISYLTACRQDEYVPHLGASFLLSLPNTHTLTIFFLFYHVLLCVFSLELIPRFWHSLNIFSLSRVFPLTFLILLSFGSF
jgi:hypothetical protein